MDAGVNAILQAVEQNPVLGNIVAKYIVNVVAKHTVQDPAPAAAVHAPQVAAPAAIAQVPAAAPAARAPAQPVPAAAPAAHEEQQAPAELEDEEPNKLGRSRKASKKAELAAVEKPARPARKEPLPVPSPPQQQAGSGRHRERDEAGQFVANKDKKKAPVKPTAAPRPPPSRKTPSRKPPKQRLTKEATSSVPIPNATRPGPKERTSLPAISNRWKRVSDVQLTLDFVRETSDLSPDECSAVEQSLKLYGEKSLICCKMSLIRKYDVAMMIALEDESADLGTAEEDKADDGEEQDEPESDAFMAEESDSSYASGSNARKRRKSRKIRDGSARKRVPRESSVHAPEGTTSGLTQDDPNVLQESHFAAQGVITTSTSHGDAAA